MRLREAFFLTVTAVAWSQTAEVAVPVLGYVHDAAQGNVRPMNGIAGAALAGPPIELGFRAASLGASSRKSDFLAANADTGELVWVRYTTEWKTQVVEVGPGRPQFAASHSGRAAASFRSGRLRVWENVEEPRFTEAELSVPCAAPQWSVSDGGERVVAVCAEAGSAAVVWPAGAAGPELMAFAFMPGTAVGVGLDRRGDLYILNDETMEWTLLRAAWLEPAAAVQTKALATGPSWIVAVGVPEIARLDRATGETRLFTPPVQAEGLFPTTERGLLRLTGASGSRPVYLFDVELGRFWFVPVPEPGQ